MFVSRLEPGQYNVEQWLVTRDQGVVRRQERVARMGTQQEEAINSGGQDATMEDVSGDTESGVVEPAVEQPALTTAAEIPPPDQESVFPASLLSVPVLSSTTPAAQDLSALPPAWIPIISRDQSVPVPRSHPYSDAYLSGQPSKRRKLNAESKPHGDVSMLVQESLQDAMDQTGLQPPAGAAAVLDQVVANSAVQETVQQMVRDTIQV